YCCQRPLLALSGHGDRVQRCPLLGVKRTLLAGAPMSAFDPKRTLRSLVTSLPYHPRLASLVDSEGRLQARLTARSQRALPLDRHQRMMRALYSVAVSEALEALASRT